MLNASGSTNIPSVHSNISFGTLIRKQAFHTQLSRIFHPCISVPHFPIPHFQPYILVPHFPVLHFPPLHFWPSRIFRSRIFSRPGKTTGPGENMCTRRWFARFCIVLQPWCLVRNFISSPSAADWLGCWICDQQVTIGLSGLICCQSMGGDAFALWLEGSRMSCVALATRHRHWWFSIYGLKTRRGRLAPAPLTLC